MILNALRRCAMGGRTDDDNNETSAENGDIKQRAAQFLLFFLFQTIESASLSPSCFSLVSISAKCHLSSGVDYYREYLLDRINGVNWPIQR